MAVTKQLAQKKREEKAGGDQPIDIMTEQVHLASLPISEKQKKKDNAKYTWHFPTSSIPGPKIDLPWMGETNTSEKGKRWEHHENVDTPHFEGQKSTNNVICVLKNVFFTVNNGTCTLKKMQFHKFLLFA